MSFGIVLPILEAMHNAPYFVFSQFSNSFHMPVAITVNMRFWIIFFYKPVMFVTSLVFWNLTTFDYIIVNKLPIKYYLYFYHKYLNNHLIISTYITCDTCKFFHKITKDLFSFNVINFNTQVKVKNNKNLYKDIIKDFFYLYWYVLKDFNFF